MSCTIPKKLKIQRCFSNKDLKSLLSDLNINSRTSLKCSFFLQILAKNCTNGSRCVCVHLSSFTKAHPLEIVHYGPGCPFMVDDPAVRVEPKRRVMFCRSSTP